MDDEVDSFGAAHADLEKLARLTGTNQHDQIVELKDTCRVAVGVEDVVVMYAVFACAGDDHRFHDVNLS